MTSSPSGSPVDPLDLTTLGADLLDQARSGSSGRAARTITSSGAHLRQVVLALVADAVLQDHLAPGAASLHVLSGALRLTWDTHELALDAGQWAPIPDTTHGVTATTDCVALLTVTPGAAAVDADS